MADFYKVQLRRFDNDVGFTGGGRELTSAERNLTGVDQELLAQSRDPTGTFRKEAEKVVFEVSPVITETRGADYVDRGLPGPTGIIVYATTQNRRFSIQGRFVSRTIDEAIDNYANVNILRSWLIPQSLDGTTGRPPIVRLNGYKKQFFNIPVVLSELSVTYPEDVDYIDMGEATVPIIQTVDLTLIESHRRAANGTAINGDTDGVSDNTRSEFDLGLFKAGNLPGY